MDCEQANEKLIPFLDQDLDAAERAEVAEHVFSCPLCREELAGLRGMLASCREVLQHPAPRSQFKRLLAEIAGERPPAARWDWVQVAENVAGKLAVAALIVLVASAVLPLVSTGENLLRIARTDMPDPKTYQADLARAPWAARPFIERHYLNSMALSSNLENIPIPGWR